MSALTEKQRFREALIARLDLTGVSAADLSRRTGVPKGTIDKLRQRRVDATNVYDAILIARFFGQSVEDFIGMQKRPDRTSEIADLLSTLPEA